MDNLIIILVVGAVVGAALGYIHKAKKRGIGCVGCPDSGSCSGNCSGCGGNCCQSKNSH